MNILYVSILLIFCYKTFSVYLPSSEPLYTDIGTDNHTVNFASNKCIGLGDKGWWGCWRIQQCQGGRYLQHCYFVHTWDLFPCHQYNIFSDVETETALFNTIFMSVLSKIYDGAEML